MPGSEVIVAGEKSESGETRPNNGEHYVSQALRRPVNVADIGSEGTALAHLAVCQAAKKTSVRFL